MIKPFRWIIRLLLKMGVGKLPWLFPIWVQFARTFIGEIATAKVGGVTVSFPAGDQVGFNLLIRGSWEPYLLGHFCSRMKAGMTVVDVGAHVGLYSLDASALVGPAGKVYAFEPEPRNYKLLLRNIKANGFSNIIALQKAVSDHPGVISLYVDPSDSSLHSTRPLSEAAVECEAVVLDQLLVGQPVDMVKIDVEGGELSVLRGMQGIMAANPQMQILCEFVPKYLREAQTDPKEMLELLIRQGFVLHALDERSHTTTFIGRDYNSLLGQECYLYCVRELRELF